MLGADAGAPDCAHGDKRTALVLSFSDLATDPRVSRQLSVLHPRFEVTAAGFRCPDTPGLRCSPVPRRHWSPAARAYAALLLKARRYERAYWSSACVQGAQDVLRRGRYDLIVANDIWTLPVALKLKGNARVLFDAHEYAPLEFEESWKWRFFLQGFNDYLCRRYVPLADAATTVCDGIAREYQRTTGTRMTVVHNSTAYQDLRPTVAAEGAPIRLVHHGAAIPSRQLEAMIEAMRRVGEGYTLDFVLVPSVPRYAEKLKSLAAGDARIRFLPPVPMHELPRFLNAYDVGIYLLPPNNFNNRHSLPNKFFEFVQARLAIAVGPSPEMAALVTRYGLGVVSDDFSPASFARVISGLDRRRVAGYKAAVDAAARNLSFEHAGEIFARLVDRTLSLPCAA